MKRHQIYRFYWFGACMRYLLDSKEGRPVDGDGHTLENLKHFFKYLDEMELAVTRRHAKSALQDIRTELAALPESSKLDIAQARKLRVAISRVRETLDSELQETHAFTTTPKRLDLDRLLEDVGKLFGPDVFDALPPVAQYDFGEAGKCIAFERPTAAAFHLLRGTEDVLRFYYAHMIRQKRVSPLMWGPIVVDLRKRPLTKKHVVLNNQLDNIRTSFRNPTQHPETIFDIHEVQDLWAVCADVVNRMYKTLKAAGRLPMISP